MSAARLRQREASRIAGMTIEPELVSMGGDFEKTEGAPIATSASWETPQHSYRRLVTVVSRFLVCNAIRKHGSDLTVEGSWLRELPEAKAFEVLGQVKVVSEVTRRQRYRSASEAIFRQCCGLNRLRLHSDLRVAFYGLSRSSQQIVNAFDQFVRALNGLLA
jgi:hypothetical protein